MHDFDIGFVKDFSKIIRLANYDFPSIVIRSLLHPKPACSFTRNHEPGLYFTVNRLTVSPATMSPVCSFALNPLAPSLSTRLQLYM